MIDNGRKRNGMTVISLGAGVQSSTMALMAAVGELEMPDCAIFADTGWEPRAVYDWLDWLEEQLPYPVYRIQWRNIRDDLLFGYETKSPTAKFKIIYPTIPFHLREPDGKSAGISRRACTAKYKIGPLYKKLRDLGATAKNPIEQWIGITVDEAHRMKPAQVKYTVARWPLIELGMNRHDCLQWMEYNKYPRPPRSACIGCPFHNDVFWRDIRDNSPKEWEDAVIMDNHIRKNSTLRNLQYMHHSRVPLGEVDLDTDYDRGQLDLFGNECEGMCGV